ncbi:SDR family NAD(P)-dependent oxidoreductase [Saccharopolyspora cebuensis]|uniref:SDR family NAD(P)-dependent oxidoreductase n=1 Tax=Saccharopolyspora cebuensis TaxID=418759 RepID=A0ABV4CAV8_9PSEU
MRDFAFPGTTALITGAASGIGEALAHDLAGRGCALALLDRDAAGLDRVARRCRALGADTSVHVVDLSDGADRADLAEEVLDRHQRVDLLVNNAGVALAGELHQVGIEDFDWLMEVNFRAVVTTTMAFLPHLRGNPGAHVVNTSSLFGLVAPAGQVAYAASKFAVRGFTEALRHELAGRGVGVTVVHPGGVKTGIATSARLGRGTDDEQRAARDEFTKHLTMPPATAARLITEAVRTRKPRLVITRTAKVLDLLARLVPGRYATVLTALSGLRK